MNLAVKITFDFEEQEYMVFVEGIPELVGYGETESSALLDFLKKYETNYSGYKCFNNQQVQHKISELTLHEEL